MMLKVSNEIVGQRIPDPRASAQRNETETKQLQNCSETVFVSVSFRCADAISDVNRKFSAIPMNH